MSDIWQCGCASSNSSELGSVFSVGNTLCATTGFTHLSLASLGLGYTHSLHTVMLPIRRLEPVSFFAVILSNDCVI